MSNLLKILFIFCCFSLFTGCATIVSGGTSQTIQINTIDAESKAPICGAKCIVSNAGGCAYTYTNPGFISVARGKGPLMVSCNKAGYLPANVSASDSFNPWVIGNIFFWPGIIVDAFSCAYSTYPNSMIIQMPRA